VKQISKYIAQNQVDLWIIGLSIFIFLLLKLAPLTHRFGDTNAYLYMAKAITEGHMPYRDFFLVDPPVLPFYLAGLRVIFGNSLMLYQAVPFLIEPVTAIVLYSIGRKLQFTLAALIVPLYLFSFTIIATSDYLTGVQITCLFTAIAIYSYLTQRNYISGIFWALAVLTKMYAAPALLGFYAYLLIKRQFKQSLEIGVGGALATLICVVPFLVISPKQFLDDVIFHHFGRPGGLDKRSVWWYFIIREGWLVFLMCIALFTQKKLYLFHYLLLPMIVFFVIFPDLYYTYLGFIMPFIILIVVELLSRIYAIDKDYQKLTWVVLGIGALYMMFSYSVYYQRHLPFGQFRNASEIGSFVRTLPEGATLYGSHEVAPLIALYSSKSIFHNYIETNPQTFASHAQNLESISQEVAQGGAYVIARITDAPEYGITDYGYQGYLSEDVFKNYCKRVKEFPSTSQEMDNKIVIYKCSK
jgi:hypothetical protein